MSELAVTSGVAGAFAAANVEEVLPELHIRELKPEDSRAVKEFCLNILMQRTRLSNQYVYSSPIWLGLYLSIIAWATNHIEPWKNSDWGRYAFLCCAISALFLVGVDYFTFFYYERLTKAASEDDKFLQNPKDFVKTKNAKCWVAYYNEGLVGTIVFRRDDAKSSSASISHWNVRARYRDKGLGSDLLVEALQHAKLSKCSNLMAQTTSINKRANKSLKQLGFRIVSTKPSANGYFRILRMKTLNWAIDSVRWTPSGGD